MSTITNPTAAELAEMVDAYKAASRVVCELEDEAPGWAEADQRAIDAYAALLALRPTEPAAMARVMRWRLAEGGTAEDDDEFFEHIADRLEAMDAAAHVRQVLQDNPRAAAIMIDREILERLAPG
jgi:hypothetical protein